MGYPICVYDGCGYMGLLMCFYDGCGCKGCFVCVHDGLSWSVRGFPCVCMMALFVWVSGVCLWDVLCMFVLCGGVSSCAQLKCSSMSSCALPTCRYETDCQVSRGWGQGTRLRWATGLRASQSEPTGLTFESSMFVEVCVIDCKSICV